VGEERGRCRGGETGGKKQKAVARRGARLEVDHTLQENCNSPSAWNFPESQKSGTQRSQSSPSVALGEELHSGKTAHEKEKVHLTTALDGAVYKKN
jgi:hypothetical protein